MRGRPSSVVGLLTGVAAAVGPILGGALTEVFGGHTSVLVCAVGTAIATVFATTSPALRQFPDSHAAQSQEIPAGTS